MSEPLTPPVPVGELIAGKYLVERVLDQGAMGVVVAAWHTELDQRVAIKFLRRELVEKGDAAERFRREARAAAKLRTKHVVRVHDVSSLDDGTPYIVMEFLDGHDLSAELRKRRRLPYREAADYIVQACAALKEAHSKSIVHRDIKPANLFLTRAADGTRFVKVLDFGVAKSLVDSNASQMALTAATALVGSPLYMSPEQLAASKDVDVRTDIWSLGTVLYELLTGKPPFSGSTLPELCTSVMQTEPPALSESGVDCPSELEAIVLQALAKKPENRWPTVQDFAAKLRPFVESSDGAVLDASLAVSAGGQKRTMQAAASPRSELGASPPGDTTRDSWGHTRQETHPVRLPRLWWLAAPVLPIVFVVGYLALRESNPAVQPPSTATAVIERVSETAPKKVVVAPSTEAPKSEPPLEASSGVPPARATAAARPEPQSDDQRPRAVARPRSLSPRAPKAAPRGGGGEAPKNPPPSASAAPATTPSAESAFTDFGGRR